MFTQNKIKSTSGKLGFTLIELMVVLAMVGIMTGVILSSLSDGRSKTAVDINARQVATVLRSAQNYALNGFLVESNHLPCQFNFYTTADGKTYGIRYTYHLPGESNCNRAGDVLSYTLDSTVAITPDQEIIFAVPRAEVAQSTSLVITQNTETQQVCIDKIGRIAEGNDC